MNIFIQNQLTSYYHFCKANNKNNRTIYLEIKHIESFFRFIDQDNLATTSDFTPTTFYNFIKYCNEVLKNSNKTINAKLTSLKNFFNYLVEYKHLLKSNPLSYVNKLINEKESAPTIIPKKHLKLILDTYDTLEFGIRDKCIALIILETALPLSTVLDLKVSNICIDFKYIDLILNSENKRFLISSDLNILLKKYLMFRIEHLLINRNSEYLFVSRRRNSYTLRNFQLQFKEVLLYSNIEEYYTPRHLRATAIKGFTNLFDKNKLSDMINQTKISHYYEIDL